MPKKSPRELAGPSLPKRRQTAFWVHLSTVPLMILRAFRPFLNLAASAFKKHGIYRIGRGVQWTAEKTTLLSVHFDMKGSSVARNLAPPNSSEQISGWDWITSRIEARRSWSGWSVDDMLTETNYELSSVHPFEFPHSTCKYCGPKRLFTFSRSNCRFRFFIH